MNNPINSGDRTPDPYGCSFQETGIKQLVTHDKSFKKIDEIEVIDPVEK